MFINSAEGGVRLRRRLRKYSHTAVSIKAMATILPITPPAIFPAFDDEWARAFWGRRVALGGDEDDDEGEGGESLTREFDVGSMPKLGEVSEGPGGSRGWGVELGESRADIDGKEEAGLLGGESGDGVGVGGLLISGGLIVGLGSFVGSGSGVDGGDCVPSVSGGEAFTSV